MIELKTIDNINSVHEIPSSSFYTNCSHCPLYTAIRTTLGLAGSMTLVVGVSECVSYVSDMGRDPVTGRSPITSVVMGWNEMTFGAEAKIREAFQELYEEFSPEAVIIVTTCIPEITNEDVDTLAGSLSEEYGIPVGAAHTAHYQQETAAGTAAVLTACVDLMEDSEPTGTVNILGDSYKTFSGLELFDVLSGSGIRYGCFLPHSSVSDIRKAPSAMLNIVTNADGLEAAQAMKCRFGTPYFFFEPHAMPDEVLADYEELFRILGKPLPESVSKLYSTALAAIESAKELYSGKTYFLGKTSFPAAEAAGLFAEIGMKPLVVSTHDIPSEDDVNFTDAYIVDRIDRSDVSGLSEKLSPDARIGMKDKHGGARVPMGFEAVTDLISQLAGRGSRHGGRSGSRGNHDRHGGSGKKRSHGDKRRHSHGDRNREDNQ